MFIIRSILVVSILVCPVAASCVQAQAMTVSTSALEQCDYRPWSAADSLDIGPDAGRFRHPTLAPTESQLYVAGTTVPSNLRIGIPSAVKKNPRFGLSSALWTGRLPGPESLGSPPGPFIFQAPRGLVSPKGTFHLVWAEPHPDSLAAFRAAAGSGGSLPLARPRFVYHAEYADGKWSSPRKLFEKRSGNIIWHNGQGPAFRVGPNRNLHLFFRMGVPRSGTMYLRRDVNGHWQRDTLKTYFGMERALAFGREGHLVRAYIGNGPGFNDGLIVARSLNGGQTWEDTTVVRRGVPGMNLADEATFVQLRGSPADTLHLVWGWRNEASFKVTDELWHAQSTDGGMTWRSRTKRTIPSNPTVKVDVIRGACGQLHVLIRQLQPRTINGQPRMFGRLYYTRWSEDGWSSLESLTSESKNVTGAGLTRWREKLWLIYGQMPTYELGSPVTIYRQTRALQSRSESGE